LSGETQQLVARCLEGHASAHGELVQKYHWRVFNLCYRMLRQHQDAEDALQETFLRALRSLRNWNPAREFEPWLLTIAANRCRTMLAVRARRPAMQPLADDPSDAEQQPASGPLGLQEELSLALAGLREDYRQAFLLFHHHRLSYEEIGSRLGRPVPTVRTWVHRARLELMGRLVRRGFVEH
jgi:RNA polymerase sigma-70 factor (ECF subfamily)